MDAEERESSDDVWWAHLCQLQDKLGDLMETGENSTVTFTTSEILLLASLLNGYKWGVL